MDYCLLSSSEIFLRFGVDRSKMTTIGGSLLSIRGRLMIILPNCCSPINLDYAAETLDSVVQKSGNCEEGAR